MNTSLAEPVNIAAIDAGSNAIRLSVARAYSAIDIEPVYSERLPLRLGESVFLRQRFSEETLSKAVQAFRHFRGLLDEHGVTKYRAVATSASREARNRGSLVRRIKKKAGIALEVITGSEESRLGREAVLAAVSPEAQPGCIVDLGGGSLEVSLLRDHLVKESVQLPAGTVRLLTTLDLPGVIRPVQAEQVRRYVRALLESRLPARPNLAGRIAAACGGNAEMLANIAPGPRQYGVRSLELSLLRERLNSILSRDVRERMKAFGARRDRADVMGIAAITFLALGRYLNLRSFLVPAVGVREGLLSEIARLAFARAERHRYDAASRQMLAGARSFARRLAASGYDQQHAEHVRELSLMLFDQLQPVHHLPQHARVLLEAGALLHDLGHVVSHRGHHKHGEYLVFHGDIPGLGGQDRAVVAALVRYHNKKAEPSSRHAVYSLLPRPEQRTARRLASLLRIAEALDHSHRERVLKMTAVFRSGAVAFQVHARGDARGDLTDAVHSSEPFEREFHLRLFFRLAET